VEIGRYCLGSGSSRHWKESQVGNGVHNAKGFVVEREGIYI
jgi:hypothetical protein